MPQVNILFSTSEFEQERGYRTELLQQKDSRQDDVYDVELSKIRFVYGRNGTLLVESARLDWGESLFSEKQFHTGSSIDR